MMAEESESWSKEGRASVRVAGNRVIKRQGGARSHYERVPLLWIIAPGVLLYSGPSVPMAYYRGVNLTRVCS